MPAHTEGKLGSCLAGRFPSLACRKLLRHFFAGYLSRGSIPSSAAEIPAPYRTFVASNKNGQRAGLMLEG